MPTDAVTAALLLERAELERVGGRGAEAVALYMRAAELAAGDHDLDVEIEAVLGLARCQPYNETPGSLPVRLHDPYVRTTDPEQRARLASALARCWAYAGEPGRARPFADEALTLAEDGTEPVLLADALDAALAAHWGPDELDLRRDWALRLSDVAAHLPDPDARLQAHLWGLTLAWEVLDLPRMHREVRALELLAEESPKARFFAASRRLALDLLAGRVDRLPALKEAAQRAATETLIPDAFGVLHNMIGYTALFAGDAATCAAEGEIYQAYAVEQGVAVVRAEAAMMWLGAGNDDRVREMIGAFTPETLAALPRDSDWLLTHQCLMEGALAVEDAELVGDLADRLGPYRGRAVINAGAVMFHGVTDDTLARASVVLGNRDDARRLGTAALATYERAGARWWRDRLERALGPLHAAEVSRTGQVVVYFHRQGGGLWVVGRSGAESVLPDLRGLHHLHALVSRPDTWIPALTLVGLTEGHPTVQEQGMETLDDQARRAYRARLVEIDRELDEAAGHADLGRRERLQDEREALLEQLDQATGLAGRRRVSGSSEERARVTVRKAIVGALARVAQADPWLARHLHGRVRTGRECAYESHSDRPIRWVLRSPSS